MWLTQMLLYWDQVSSIVPSEFIPKPEWLGTYRRGLVQEELVFQVIPLKYLDEIPNFVDSFLAHVDGLGPEGARRRTLFARGKTSEIHIEKMGNIGYQLVRRRIARP